MNRPLRRLLSCALCLMIFFSLLPASQAEETDAEETKSAESIYVYGAVTNADGFTNWGYLFDGELLYGGTSAETASLTMEYSDGIGSLYFLYSQEYGEYTVTNNDTGETAAVGQGNFLHDFIDLVELFGSAPTSVTVSWDNGAVKINEMYIFTEGETPDYVQKWEMPADGETDLILFSTHGDDEQLFFAGILPYYANALGYQVQVVYLTDHRSYTDVRVHEMLNGLWAVGCTTYPILGSFSDFRYDSLEETYAVFASQGVTRDDIIEYCVEQIRRFKPLVIVAHDFNGEYGHGQHMVYADCVAAALEISNDASYFPESAEAYGVWDVPKAYFHLYEENQIVMDWDTPMEELDGMTPFEVTKLLGFACHETQLTSFNWWINSGETASEIPLYNPCLYGLYRTTVGLDVEKNDFFENLTTYAEQKALALAQEQEQTAPTTVPTEAAQEDEVSETLSSLPQDSEATLAAEQEELTQAEQEAAARKNRIMLIIVGVALVLIGIMVLYNLWQESQRRRRRKRRPRPKMENLEK